MAWGAGRSKELMGELLGMLLEGKPATWQNRGKPQRKHSDKPKRGEFGDEPGHRRPRKAGFAGRFGQGQAGQVPESFLEGPAGFPSQ
eukprot:1418012-Amphidinium_carterae.1